MRPNDAFDQFATEFSYPITRDEVVEASGDGTVQAPNGPDESIADVLGRAGTSTFDSPEELQETFLANLGGQYVGRKFYDDRGRNFGPGGAITI